MRLLMGVVTGWQGRFFDDFVVGDIYRSRYGRTITEADNIAFTLLTNNTNPIHFSRDAGERSPWGNCLVNSALTLSVVAGLGVTDISENGFALGWNFIRMPAPMFPGETVYSESEVLSVRESRSDPTRGVVTVLTRGVKTDGTVVIEFERSVMVWKRDHAPAADFWPTTTPRDTHNEQENNNDEHSS